MDSDASSSFLDKAKRAVKGFIQGAVSGLPTTAIFTGVIFAASAGLAALTGINLLPFTATNFLGSVALSSAISGAAKGYESVASNSNAIPGSLALPTQPASSPVLAPSLDITVPYTPTLPRSDRARM